MKTYRKPDIQTRAQIVSLLRIGMSIHDIGERLGMTRAVDHQVIFEIREQCDFYANRHKRGRR